MKRLLLLPALPLVILLVSASDPPIQPGKWENKVEVVDIQIAGAPPGLAAMMKERPRTVTTCVTPEQAAKGPRAAMNSDKSCTFTKYQIGGGRIASELVCKRPRGDVRIKSQGTYTPTSYATNGVGQMTGKVAVTIKTRTTGKRLGGC